MRSSNIGRAARRRRLVDPRATVSELDRAMMRRAIELAAEAGKRDEVPVGAVVYRDGAVVAEAMNLRHTTADPVGHAELVALREAGRILGRWRLTDCSLAVTLEPCPMCAGAAVNARLGRLVYGATDPKAGACHTLYRITQDVRLNHRVTVIGGVLAEPCAELLGAFFAPGGREVSRDRDAGRHRDRLLRSRRRPRAPAPPAGAPAAPPRASSPPRRSST